MLLAAGKATTHTDADAGSFFIEMEGAQVATDLGSDSYYTLPGEYSHSGEPLTGRG